MMNIASQQMIAVQEGEIPGDEDAMDIYQDQSPSLAQARKRRIEQFDLQSQYESQSLSSTGGSSIGSHTSPFEYGFLTQAPYQSQSLSQSQS